MLAEGIIHALTDDVMKLVALSSAASVVLLTLIMARAWRGVRRSENRTALIAMMLQRGMSAENIERVLNAGGLGVGGGESEGEEYDPEVRIITVLKENEYKGDDVERVLETVRHRGRIDAATAKIVETLVEQEAGVDEIVGVLEARQIGVVRVGV